MLTRIPVAVLCLATLTLSQPVNNTEPHSNTGQEGKTTDLISMIETLEEQCQAEEYLACRNVAKQQLVACGDDRNCQCHQFMAIKDVCSSYCDNLVPLNAAFVNEVTIFCGSTSPLSTAYFDLKNFFPFIEGSFFDDDDDCDNGNDDDDGSQWHQYQAIDHRPPREKNYGFPQNSPPRYPLEDFDEFSEEIEVDSHDDNTYQFIPIEDIEEDDFDYTERQHELFDIPYEDDFIEILQIPTSSVLSNTRKTTNSKTIETSPYISDRLAPRNDNGANIKIRQVQDNGNPYQFYDFEDDFDDDRYSDHYLNQENAYFENYDPIADDYFQYSSNDYDHYPYEQNRLEDYLDTEGWPQRGTQLDYDDQYDIPVEAQGFINRVQQHVGHPKHKLPSWMKLRYSMSQSNDNSDKGAQESDRNVDQQDYQQQDQQQQDQQQQDQQQQDQQQQDYQQQDYQQQDQPQQDYQQQDQQQQYQQQQDQQNDPSHGPVFMGDQTLDLDQNVGEKIQQTLDHFDDFITDSGSDNEAEKETFSTPHQLATIYPVLPQDKVSEVSQISKVLEVSAVPKTTEEVSEVPEILEVLQVPQAPEILAPENVDSESLLPKRPQNTFIKEIFSGIVDCNDSDESCSQNSRQNSYEHRFWGNNQRDEKNGEECEEGSTDCSNLSLPNFGYNDCINEDGFCVSLPIPGFEDTENDNKLDGNDCNNDDCRSSKSFFWKGQSYSCNKDGCTLLSSNDTDSSVSVAQHDDFNNLSTMAVKDYPIEASQVRYYKAFDDETDSEDDDDFESGYSYLMEDDDNFDYEDDEDNDNHISSYEYYTYNLAMEANKTNVDVIRQVDGRQKLNDTVKKLALKQMYIRGADNITFSTNSTSNENGTLETTQDIFISASLDGHDVTVTSVSTGTTLHNVYGYKVFIATLVVAVGVVY